VTALPSISVDGATTASASAASAGPTVSPRSSSALNNPMPAGRRSPGVSRGRPVRAAGWNSAVPTPASAAPAIIAGSEWAFITIRNARQRSTSATVAHTRQPTRSTSAPSSGPSTIAGSRSGSSTAEIAHALSKRS
jgi:hypothetical protein